MQYSRTIAGADVIIDDLGAKIMVSVKTRSFSKSWSVSLEDVAWIAEVIEKILEGFDEASDDE